MMMMMMMMMMMVVAVFSVVVFALLKHVKDDDIQTHESPTLGCRLCTWMTVRW
jgi:uncharacterized membrane protein